jgi:hypothetical protein
MKKKKKKKKKIFKISLLNKIINMSEGTRDLFA